MKKLNVDYSLVDTSGVLLKKGHINYSISHYIYALYQKAYTTPSPQDFWINFKNALSNIGMVSFAFANNAPEILNKASRIGIMQILHSFGYFAYHDIAGTYPVFVKHHSGKIHLVDYNSNQAMSFGFSIPAKHPKTTYAKLYMSSFVCSTPNSIVNQDGTFYLKIVDPFGNDVVDKIALSKYNEYKKAVLAELNDPKTYELTFKATTLKVYVSKHPLINLENTTEWFSDGEIYVYVEELLKVSYYTHFIDEENLVLSLRTASLIKLDDKKYFQLKAGQYSTFDEDEVFLLKEMGLLVPYVNEYKQLQQKRKTSFASEHQNDSFGFTILTTTKCNARCPYCFEKGIKQVVMDSSTQEKVADFVCHSPSKKVHISWFGGEPLLNINAINYITNRMQDQGISFTESIVTNGYLIDKYINNFPRWNISNIQITLDGVYEKYDRIKNYVHKGPAFEKIISNIEAILNNNISTSIRFNFSKHNYLDILEGIDYIHKRFGNAKYLSVYAHHIFGESFYLDDGTNAYVSIYKKLVDCGYINNLEDFGLKAKTFFCFINNSNHKVIDPDGKLYLCEHIADDNKNKCVGDLDNGITNQDSFDYWSDIAYPYHKCSKCKFIFFCQGGCKNERNEEEYSCCIPYIDSIDEIIKYYYNKKEN